MKHALLRKLTCCQGFRLSWAEDEHIRLRVKRVYCRVRELGNADCVIFAIVDKRSGKTAGEIALRLGEDKALFYLGHVGYHVNPPYQGRHIAARACGLCRPLLREAGLDTAVITTDEDNLPSVKTCERLGCVLESTVDVPGWCVKEFGTSRRKRRYIFWTA